MSTFMIRAPYITILGIVLAAFRLECECPTRLAVRQVLVLDHIVTRERLSAGDAGEYFIDVE